MVTHGCGLHPLPGPGAHAPGCSLTALGNSQARRCRQPFTDKATPAATGYVSRSPRSRRWFAALDENPVLEGPMPMRI